MGCPASSRRHRGVTVVPQFLQATSSEVFGEAGCAVEFDVLASDAGRGCAWERSRLGVEDVTDDLASLLL